MPGYEISFARSARKELEALPDQIAERILAKIDALAKNPRPVGCKPLKGPLKLWRLRIGDYRVVYEIDDNHQKIDVSIVRHRSETYR